MKYKPFKLAVRKGFRDHFIKRIILDNFLVYSIQNRSTVEWLNWRQS